MIAFGDWIAHRINPFSRQGHELRMLAAGTIVVLPPQVAKQARVAKHVIKSNLAMLPRLGRGNVFKSRPR
jgi:hypothetical protein